MGSKCVLFLVLGYAISSAQTPPKAINRDISKIVSEISQEKIAATQKKLELFVTRNIYSSQTDTEKGVGAARRWIFEQFAKCGSATAIMRELTADGFRNRYGQRLDKGRIYKLLNNRVYIGEAVHKGVAYAGEHEPIVAKALWDKVHATLTESPRARAGKSRAQTPALLKGLAKTYLPKESC